MKYTIPVIIIAAIVLAFIKDESGESYLTKIASTPMQKVQKGRDAVDQTRGIMEKRDNQIQEYIDEPTNNQDTQISEGGYGKKMTQ